MLQVSRDADLAEESLVSQRLSQFRVNHLDGNRPIVLQVLGQPDRRHAAPTKLSLDPVIAGKRGLEPAEDIGHAKIRVVMDGLHYSGHRSPHTPSLSCPSGACSIAPSSPTLRYTGSVRSTSSFTALM